MDCKKVTDVGTVGPGGVDELNIHFLECGTSQAGCDVSSPGAPLGLIQLNNIPTLLTLRENPTTKKQVIADEFKSNATTKEFVKLVFHALPGGSCSEWPETTVKGQVAAETNGELLNFTNPELAGNTIEAFGKAAKFVGDANQMLTNGGKLGVK